MAEKKKELPFIQNIELQKIQVIESNYQGWFNFRGSIIAGGFVGALILIATMQYQNFIIPWVGYISDAIVIVAIAFFMQDLKNTRDKHITFIDGLLLRVGNSNNLESINELLNIQRKGAKKKRFRKAKGWNNLNLSLFPR